MTEEQIINFIEATRVSKGISQENVARKAGICTSTVHRMETQNRSPRLSTLIEICKILGLQIVVKPAPTTISCD